MSLKQAFSKLTRPAMSDTELLSTRKSVSNFLNEKEYIYSSDDVLSDESDIGSRSGSKTRAKHAKGRSSVDRSRDRPSSTYKRSLDISSRSRSPLSDRTSEFETPQSSRTSGEFSHPSDYDEPEEIKVHYGDLPMMQSRDRPRENLAKFESIVADSVGQELHFRARIHAVRRMGPKLVFLVFRQQVHTLQGVLAEEKGKVSEHMVRWAEHIRQGTIVRAKGRLKRPEVPIKGTTIRDVELQITDVHVLVRREDPIAFSVYEAALAVAEDDVAEGRRTRIPDRTRLSNRILDLRTDTSQSIFRIQSAVCNAFRTALDNRRFVEIHTPKLQGSATESGSSVFGVNYFGRPAFLAQSPQLAKQMAIAADFERVYEIGPVFRAENSNTHRHLTEYTGLDLEMAIEEHYHEALELVDSLLKEIFAAIYSKKRLEVDIIKKQFPHDDLVWLEETPIIPYAEGIKILNDSGWTDDEGKQLSPDEDLGTRDEIRLGELIKEKYGTDYYIMDKFPVAARPFYAMLDPENPKVTNAFDIYVRGQEIISGGQRIHDPAILEERMRQTGVDPVTMDEYLEGFRWAAPPHAGIGIGLERLVMLLLNLNDIRFASLFHRDPKSFPHQSQPIALRHPEASTVNPPWETESRLHKDKSLTGEKKLQRLEDLIANYGDATSTNWLDDKYKIWRDSATGAAVSYVPSHGYAIIPGNPLCDSSQYRRTVGHFLRWLRKQTKLKPIWILCSLDIEDLLGEKYGWRSLSCIAEERIDTTSPRTLSDGEVARKIRKAENDGLKVTALPPDQPVPQELRDKIDARIEDWKANREGSQIHLSEIEPWKDMDHRRYFYCSDKDGKICSFVVLAQLAPRHGMQVKYALDFPGSPSGSIEYIIHNAIQWAAKSSVKQMTFGAGATARLSPAHNMGSTKIRFLQHTYDAIMNRFGLNRKSEFRAKMGAYEDPLYIAYPKHGLGSKGIKALMDFFGD